MRFLKILTPLLIPMMIFVQTASGAVQAPEELKAKADSQVKSASLVAAEALNLIQGQTTPPKVKAALELYARAGQLYENSYQIYVAVGPQYANKDDVQNAYAAMQNCLNTIKELKKSLRP
ncbi:MAG: hypothetical protein PHN49_03480 [Candidatus Omnitrophica bacterium]|nr:hypothetical protein [Candidatus Omnitrophota bacterium]MDD5670681.1 hypothetical protein [Candidatus Omnitrophota bacterium]